MSTSHAIRIHKPGGPEVLTWEKIDLGSPGDREVRVRHTAIGLNYIDIYHRTGLYPLDMPTGIGLEGAGVVEAVGPAVRTLAVGDRVAYGTGPIGSYSQAANLPETRVTPIPDGISDEQAAAMMLQGLTAYYLLKKTFPVKKGDTVLIHAAAGGVGLIVCQWAGHLGATVIGTVGSDEKASLAKKHGCDHPILYGQENFVDRVDEITGGGGVNVVYDSVGKETVPGSLRCLAPRGMLVSFGNASGPPDPVDIGSLGAKGSLFVTRPSLFHYMATDEDLKAAAQDLIEVVEKGIVRIRINQRYKLEDAAQAHTDLESRRTTGSTILIP